MPREMSHASLNQQLLNAVMKKNKNDAESCLRKKANVNHTNNDNKTLLYLAIQNLNLPMIKLLLEYGANPNYEKPLNSNSSITELFLQYYTDLHYNSPLYLATSKGNFNAVELLLKHGANPNYDVPLCLLLIKETQE